ncbi:uncharacterized protein ASCRUDRAFT_71030 [Ascoidea rubescens DSM 1968]|uniref:Uncharacterized protein n=1 Tax=Ascoidea rubescens DSM 1968 TaxID=1344418 RepID=A0A1D2VG30_9ASCO|nr:hypothetical protein ASCRUDRAFT_71030 [Ascoidea rubescens DSM 1968]ODV60542.1 hypothetical protein ASCRUDRAFT_71030 [Ascoidea rubescens DSM 1968]
MGKKEQEKTESKQNSNRTQTEHKQKQLETLEKQQHRRDGVCWHPCASSRKTAVNEDGKGSLDAKTQNYELIPTRRGFLRSGLEGECKKKHGQQRQRDGFCRAGSSDRSARRPPPDACQLVSLCAVLCTSKKISCVMRARVSRALLNVSERSQNAFSWQTLSPEHARVRNKERTKRTGFMCVSFRKQQNAEAHTRGSSGEGEEGEEEGEGVEEPSTATYYPLPLLDPAEAQCMKAIGSGVQEL